MTICKKCGSDKRTPVKRKRPDTGEYYETTRCGDCANAYQRKNRHLTLNWQRANRDHVNAYQQKYFKGKHRERNGVNARRVRQRTIYGDRQEIKAFYRNCPDGYEVDHIIPLNGRNVSGLHTVSNLQYLTAEDNRKKSNKF